MNKGSNLGTSGNILRNGVAIVATATLGEEFFRRWIARRATLPPWLCAMIMLSVFSLIMNSFNSCAAASRAKIEFDPLHSNASILAAIPERLSTLMISALKTDPGSNQRTFVFVLGSSKASDRGLELSAGL